MASQAKSPREIEEVFDELAVEIEDGRELDRRLKIPEGCPQRRRRALIEALAHKLGFPHDSRFSQSEVLGRLRLSEGLEQEQGVAAVPKASSAPGRPPRGVALNGAAFKAWRGHHTQEKFAEFCNVATSTIQRAESSLPIGKPLLMKIIECGNKKLTRKITIADLT